MAGEPGWRGRQLAEALYRQRLADLSEITTLPKPLRKVPRAMPCTSRPPLGGSG